MPNYRARRAFRAFLSKQKERHGRRAWQRAATDIHLLMLDEKTKMIRSQPATAAISGNTPLKLYQIIITKADGSQYSSIRSEPFGDHSIEIFGIESSVFQAKKTFENESTEEKVAREKIEKEKRFQAWLALAQLAPVMPTNTPCSDFEERRYQAWLVIAKPAWLALAKPSIPEEEFCSKKLEPIDETIYRFSAFQGSLPPVFDKGRFAQAANFTAAKIRPSLFANKENAEFQNDLFQVALDAALNADFAVLKNILENNPNPDWLNQPGKAVITHSGVERTGTVLQMAIYGHDEEMVAFLKEKMDPKEFYRQCEEILGDLAPL